MDTLDVLLVDDNIVQGATRSAILSRAGFKVMVAQHPEKALEYLQDPHFGPHTHLILTDHLMPLMNGPELVTRLRQFLPEIPVIVLSGLPDAEGEYNRLNVVFRAKPFPPDDLIALVQTILLQRELKTA